ncbi:MAG: glycoside hydrolase [bacterium]|nr:glycoside hydrolase [bacterium]
MLKKNYTKTGGSCRVTFKVPAETEAEKVFLLGEFNAWDAEQHPLVKRKDGSHSLTVSLPAGTDYRFRYLADGEHWLNDESPDRLEYNRFGSRDCVITV